MRRNLLGSILTMAVFFGCGDGGDPPTGPTEGSIEVTIQTTGEDLPEGFSVALDGGAGQPVDINGSITLPNLAPGMHSVELTKVPANCTFTSANPLTVTVVSGASTPVSVTVSCTRWRSRIAFHGYDADIYVMNPDGTSLTNLTNSGWIDRYPVWSPDGGRIAFWSERNGIGGIYVMNADGSAEVRLDDYNWMIAFDVAWSPDGAQLAFRDLRDGRHDIFTVNSDGSQLTNLTNSPDTDVSPNWSPDGNKIAFVSNRDGNNEIYVMNVDGSGAISLTDSPFYHNYLPNWSPDGSRIAFLGYRDNNYDIYTVNADGSGETRLTSQQGWGVDGLDDGPVWSPDGGRIAFSGPGASSKDIFVVNADGSNETNLTNRYDEDAAPTWSPDGNYIVYNSNHDKWEIWSMKADGSEPVRLSEMFGRKPQWSPELP